MLHFDFERGESNAVTEREGMSQRIKWVDDQFSDVPRVILHISLKRYLRRRRIVRSSVLAVEDVNLFFHFPRILYLALRSDYVYVHSCYNALSGLILYFLGLRIITDMHGAVPEEEELRGRYWRSKVLSFVEKIVVRRSSALIFVTNSMQNHFKRKLSLGKNTRTYIIPIQSSVTPHVGVPIKDPSLVIYVGGLQAWQRVDQMLDVVERTASRFKYIFLTGDQHSLRQKLHRRGITQIQVVSVPKSMISEYYERASLGFIIRSNSIINRVSCPTKLVEYLWYGVIPIVGNPLIGDFNEKGYRYILVDDFMSGQLPSNAELNTMRERNYQLAQELQKMSVDEFSRMRTKFIEA